MRKPTGVLYRRSAHLVSYWEKERMIFENYATGVRIAAEPIACEILRLFDEWRPAELVFLRLREFTALSLKKALRELCRYSLLERRDRLRNRAEQAMLTWRQWNPSAGFFHFSTKDTPFTSEPAGIARLLRQRARKWPVPPPIKRYPRARQISLPAPRTGGEFPKVMLARRTWRRFSTRPIQLSELATLLKLTWGVQQWVRVPGIGRLALKTSPSAGALHPVEPYLLALRVTGLPAGLYHYAADTHRLELLKAGASSRQIANYLPAQGWYGSAAALMLMTAVFPRTQWKYWSPRAYRTVLLDSGHLCQSFCLVATWLGLAPFCTMALADSRIEKDLGVDGVTESVIYAAGVGSRPRALAWAPSPPSRYLS